MTKVDKILRAVKVAFGLAESTYPLILQQFHCEKLKAIESQRSGAHMYVGRAKSVKDLVTRFGETSHIFCLLAWWAAAFEQIIYRRDCASRASITYVLHDIGPQNSEIIVTGNRGDRGSAPS
jgi:NADH dehydrogenase FAD-containing subunit